MASPFLTDHFTVRELSCPCCGRFEMQADFMQKLEWLRVKYKKAISPSSAYRCPEHNKAVGGKPESFHLKGQACDIPVTDPKDRHNLVLFALQLRLTVIIYPGFVHVDNRKEPLLLLGEAS